MRAATGGPRQPAVDFDALGKTLSLLDGEQVKMSMATLPSWPAESVDDARFLGGVAGTLRIVGDAGGRAEP